MQGRQWALHILEGPWAWLLAAAYIIGTVIAGWPIFTAIAVTASPLSAADALCPRTGLCTQRLQ